MGEYSLPRVLVVDDSRMVRASLCKHLQGHFEIREEADGEAAWQTLVLDHALVAVISDLQMPRLDGYGLLERVRSSKLRRLQTLPFILVSGEESEEERQRAQRLGVSDFITKGVGTAELLTRLNHLLELNRTKQRVEESRSLLVQDDAGIFTRKYIELQAAQALSHAARHGSEVSVMVLGLDGFAEVSERLGSAVADQIASRFATLLAGKMRREDSLGHFERGQFAIVSPGTSPARCTGFAERVREAMLAARVAVRGENLKLTVSAGVANAPEDRVVSAGSLLDLAAGRMREAMQSGGNRIVGNASLQPEVPAPVAPLSVLQALELLRKGERGTLHPQLASLGLQILPLLAEIDTVFSLRLPMPEIERRLRQQNISSE